MLDSLFNPRSVAVVGASSKHFHIGNRIIRNLIDFGYKGSIYPINPKADRICEIRAYKSILAVPGQVDLAHIVIPAKFVPIAVKDCGKKGVKNVIINSGGFSETGCEGKAIQSELMEVATKYGIRILGPNCQGIINSDKNVRAYCNFTFTFPKAGNISIVALSGGVAEVLHQGFVSVGIGTRIYASSGNACDISISEIIEYLGNDDATRVIVLYVEGLKNPKSFMKTLKQVAIKKPILAMKAGCTDEGAKAAASHTGELTRKNIAAELIFDKTGVMHFKNEGRMLDAAIVLSSQPIPKGHRVGIITNTGGPAVIAADVLVDAGLSIAKLSNNTIERLTKKLHKEASVSNPIDVLATGTAEHYRESLEAMMTDDNVDSILINFVTPFFVDTESIAEDIAEVNRKKIKPIVCNLMTDLKQWSSTEKILRDGGVPCFKLPSETAHALKAIHQYSDISKTDLGFVKHYDDVNFEIVSNILKSARDRNQTYLSSNQVYSILDAYKINIPSWYVVQDEKGALEAASKIGYPVVLKADLPSLIHKSDVGGVAINLSEEKDLKTAIASMYNKLEDENLKFLVQKYRPSEVELIIGAKYEPDLGHAIMFGLGGVFVEVFKDIVFKLAPIGNLEAEAMIKSIKSYNILSGFRGYKGVNIDLLIKLIQRLSQLLGDFNEIKELDFNPIVASRDDIFVLDARIFLKR